MLGFLSQPMLNLRFYELSSFLVGDYVGKHFLSGDYIENRRKLPHNHELSLLLGRPARIWLSEREIYLGVPLCVPRVLNVPRIGTRIGTQNLNRFFTPPRSCARARPTSFLLMLSADSFCEPVCET